jgi:hypothetical protein
MTDDEMANKVVEAFSPLAKLAGHPLLENLRTIRNLTDKGTVTAARRDRINELVRKSITDLTRALGEHEEMRERLAELEEISGQKGERLTWRGSGRPLVQDEEELRREDRLHG